ncbi:MAG: RelA/SpoT family protein [bacterium]|nr:RelA/SpoT family protein [bacterium]
MSSISSVDEILSLMPVKTSEDEECIRRAYDFAEVAHSNQVRKSGEPYFIHAAATAKNLAMLGLDSNTIVAGLLHDTVEDAGISREEIEANFGETVRFLVDGVTKLGEIKYSGDDRRAESLRKLFIAMAQDIRVLIIKLADRLHNIQTLEHVEPNKQRRIALETLEIYAPLANRLGMGKLQAELEDGAFLFAYPKEAAHIQSIFQEHGKNAQASLEKVYNTLNKELIEQKVHAETSYRIKHLYSLHKKLLRKELNIEKVYDLMALRVVTDTLEDCYRVLGIIHANWKPLPGRIKDYIALPKPNGYQSIHTTVFTGDGEIAEIQIRTRAMHDEAEYGIAAHLAYNESGKPKSGGRLSKKLQWVQQLIDWQKNFSESNEFLENLKLDFFQYRVFTFTPKGDVIELPENATPVDFAYAVHSELGMSISGAKVNGKLAALSTKLKNGDIVEIMSNKTHKPSYKWLDFVKTSYARKKIRTWISKNKDKKI